MGKRRSWLELPLGKLVKYDVLTEGRDRQLIAALREPRGCGAIGSAPPCQGEGCEFEPRQPLK